MGWKMNSHEKARKSDGRKKAQKDAKNWDAEILRLCDTVRETSFAIHKFLRSGHLEKIYENALAHRLRKAGITVQQQFPLDVCDEDGTPLGHLVADLFIEECLIETIGCCGMTHSAAMASEIMTGKTILEALNTDLVCDAINVAMRELFLQIA